MRSPAIQAGRRVRLLRCWTGLPLLVLALGLVAAGHAAAPAAQDLPLPQTTAPGTPGGPLLAFKLSDPVLPVAAHPAPGPEEVHPAAPPAARHSNPLPAREPLPAGVPNPPLTHADQVLHSSNLEDPAQVEKTKAEDPIRLQHLHTQLSLARQQRREQAFELAQAGLLGLLEDDVPAEIQRAALFEMALLAHDAGELPRAQQVFAKYLSTYPQDATVPEVLLRQGLIYRQMGATGLAIAKFYAVMTSALNLKLDKMEYYERLVLQAQTEIADTYFAEAKYEEAADFFSRLLRRDSPHLNKVQIHFKLIRCLAALRRSSEVLVQGQRFVELHPDTAEVAEVRFLLATTFKQLGRNADAQRQVILLLEGQRDNARRSPELWTYWQKRAGNEIANHFYQEGDYQTTLTIYEHLANLDARPDWRLPVLYQIGLVYERLLQPARARETYDTILQSQKELTGTNLAPSLAKVLQMARWRKDAIGWLDRAQTQVLALQGTIPGTP